MLSGMITPTNDPGKEKASSAFNLVHLPNRGVTYLILHAFVYQP